MRASQLGYRNWIVIAEASFPAHSRPGVRQVNANEEIPVVLSAFGQGSIAIKAAEQGTGLGLPIVQGLLAMHDGEFYLESKLRQGTEAIAVLPPSRVMEELPAIPTQEAKPQRGPRRAMAS